MSAKNNKAERMRPQAGAIIRIAPYLVILAAVLFITSLPFTPRSVPFLLVAVIGGAISFSLTWLYWRRPSAFLSFASTMLVVFSHSIAEHTFFPRIPFGQSWLLLLQFLSAYFFVQLSLTFIFRHRLRESINSQSTVA